MPYGGLDLARVENNAGMDQVVTSSRMRALLNPITIGTVTFPTNPLGTNWIQGSGTPISTTPGATSTLDVGQLLTGFIIQNSGATSNTSTLDSAANIVKGVNAFTAGAQIGDVICCYLGNGSSTTGGTITLQAGSGGAFDANFSAGSRTLPISTSRFVFVRLTNVTAGSEAYVVYM